MKIFEQNRLSPSYLQFAGVLILEGDNLNEFFRKMESPQHDKWEPDRVDSSERNIAKQYKTEMENAINNKKEKTYKCECKEESLYNDSDEIEDELNKLMVEEIEIFKSMKNNPVGIVLRAGTGLKH